MTPLSGLGQNLLQKEWREDVFGCKSGIIENKGQKPIVVNGISDQIRVLIEPKPFMALSDLIREVKTIHHFHQ